ncbi:MAG: CDP-alcohol phosphatidyltransferase family protein [Anaerolineae bacterium]
MPEQQAVGRKSATLRVLADLLTASRLLLAVLLVAVGLGQRQEGLGLAVALFAIGWTADTFDGHLGERSGYTASSFFSRNDVAVDVVFSLGGLSYFILAGFVPLVFGIGYVVAGAIVFALAPCRSVMVAIEVPIALIPLVVSLIKAPTLALLIALWALALLAIDFRRFRWRLSRFVHGLSTSKRGR